MPSKLLPFLIFIFAINGSFALAENRPTFGWTERVQVYPSKSEVKSTAPKGALVVAKLDTGADYSSLDASEFEEFERDGKSWVRFIVTSPDGERTTFEERVVRTALIKVHGGKHQKRNVIRLGICLGSTYTKADVNLVDRSNFKLQMLLGRNYLAGAAAIDPALSFTANPKCVAPGETSNSKETAPH